MTVLITGGHSGIGLVAAQTLAGEKKDLVLAGRSPERMQAVAGQLRSTYGIEVALLEMDVSSLASVREAAAQLAAMPPVEAVLCNAGGRFDGPVSYTPDGYETTFATNCLGHFLLVELLVPHLAEGARVVFTASGTHDPDSVDGRMVGAAVEPDATVLARAGKELSAGKRYSTSKMCTVMYAYELARRQPGVVSIAYDPGSVPETGFLRGMPAPVRFIATSRPVKWLMKRLGVTSSTVAFSGAALAKLATDPRYASASGQYLQANDGTLAAVRSARLTYDQARAEKLWRDSEQLVH